MPRVIDIDFPFNFKPRWYQENLWKAFDSDKYNRFILVWHRRSGKDLDCFAIVQRYLAEHVCLATYVFPTLKQGREVLWEGMDNEGRKFIDYYASKEFMDGKPNDTRMTIKYKNGSIFRIGGADDPDSLRGGNTKIFVFSEWSEHDPYIWAVCRPIVKANKGIAIFNLTPKGDNHAKLMWNVAQKRKDWFTEILTAKDTKVFTDEELDNELKELIEELGEEEGRARFNQEYMCSFEMPVSGSYYGAQIRRAENDKRITNVPYETNLLVNTYWDLGIGDATSIWFAQQSGREVRLIDYYETSGEPLAYYKQILNDRGYTYGEHWMPHDVEVKELGTGKTRKEVAEGLGIKPIYVAPKLPIDDGIEAARNILSRCWFDKNKCERGIMALKNYHKEWDDKNKTYKKHPHHDWSSHGADSFRYLAVSIREPLGTFLTGFEQQQVYDKEGNILI